MTEPAVEGQPLPRERRKRLLTTGILVLGLIGLTIAVREALRDAHGVHLPGPVPLAIAFVAIRVSLWCTAGVG